MQPILTPFCKGKFILCEDMMEKWISKELGTQGYTAIQILQYFFGDSLYINATNNISKVQYNWSGTDLSLNSTGDEVMILQQYLIRIAEIYTQLPIVEVNGIYDQLTADSVKTYQSIFRFPVSGTVDVGTWYSIMMFFNQYNNVVLIC
jgi:hypothetical protein